MGLLSFLRQTYTLDTLDTRFTTASSTPYKTVIEARADVDADSNFKGKANGSIVNQAVVAKAQPSRWTSPEYLIWNSGVTLGVVYMLWAAYTVSRPSAPEYHKFAHRLEDGWVPGRKIDTSDSQYHTFRSNLPAMAALLVFHPLLRRLYNTVVYPLNGPSSRSSSRASTPISTPVSAPEDPDARLNQRASFDFGFAILFLLILHGFSAFKILFILYLNYKVATALPRKYVPVATWVFNVGTLFANEFSTGYKFEKMALFLTGPPQHSVSGGEPTLLSLAKWLDSYGGIMSRWEILFNITVLRLISFNLDYYWSQDRASYGALEKQLDPSALSERDRVTIPAPARDYSFRNYIAYIVYAPLYLTGPIITFNDFISQLRYKPATIETHRTIRYAVRFAATLLVMELCLHFNYIQAIAKSNPAWDKYTPGTICLLSLLNLHFIWMKLLLPWRLFRLWGLVDGVDAPENMIRCVTDNYSTLSFWRSWHRSFYRWSLRYIYIPLGGSSFRSAREAGRSLVTYLLVFTFVALWHDIEMNLLVWGWLIVFFMMPEMMAGYLFPTHRFENRPFAFRMIAGAGAVGNIFMMITANTIGFAVGVEGMKNIVAGIFKEWTGIFALVVPCMFLFCLVQVMFEVRQGEMRKGIDLKC